GACATPTNCQKLTASVIGFFLAAAGARDVLPTIAWSWKLVPILAFLAAAILSTVLSKARKPTVVLPSVNRSDGLLTQGLYVGLAILASQLGAIDRETVVRAFRWGAVWVGIVAYGPCLGEAQWALPPGRAPAEGDTKLRPRGRYASAHR